MNAKDQVEACLENEVAIFNEGSLGAALISICGRYECPKTGFCAPNDISGDLCAQKDPPDTVNDITACEGASNGNADRAWYLQSSCDQECAQQRCDDEPLCTVRSCFSSYARQSLLL